MLTLPQSVSICLSDNCYDGWSSTAALAIAKRDGWAESIVDLAEQASNALRPIDREKLRNSVTTVGLAMAPNRPADAGTAWVSLMVHGLSDLPASLVSEALNEWVRTSKFLPTVAEIRALAEPKLAKMERDAARLDCLVRLIASGADVPAARAAPESKGAEQFREEDRCTPEQAAAILSELGISSAAAETAKLHLGPPREPTAADYAALGVAPEHIPTRFRRAA